MDSILRGHSHAVTEKPYMLSMKQVINTMFTGFYLLVSPLQFLYKAR